MKECVQSLYGWPTIKGNIDQHAKWIPGVYSRKYVIHAVPSHVALAVIQYDCCPRHACQVVPDDSGAYQIVLSKGARIILPLRKEGYGGKHDVSICVDSKGKLCVERTFLN